jgi:D-mannonate dehydratase
MAVLKALTRTQLAYRNAEAAKALAFKQKRYGIAKPMRDYDAHVQAYRDHLVATFTGRVEVLPTGKPLRASHHWQADYRSFAPKGVTLLSDKLKGIYGRRAVK